jgi:prephenate dehydrogenase
MVKSRVSPPFRGGASRLLQPALASRAGASYIKPVQFRKITLVGVGLLGGSLGLAIKRRRLAERVAGYVRRAASVDECVRAGVADEVATELEPAVTEADLVVLCTPIAQMRSLAERMAPCLKPGALITDVGSVKSSVVRDLEPFARRAGAVFIGSHPMAGAEKMGVAAARADLFEKAWCVVTPAPGSAPGDIDRLRRFWESVGSRTMVLDPELHDQLVSRSSHLPHLVAAGLSNLVLDPGHPREQALLCASGFRDTTRVASGSPEMWRDIALANRENLVRGLGEFLGGLRDFQRALEAGDEAAVIRFFQVAKQRRDAWCEQTYSPE